ncbi:MAG: nuclear transport factor 2 family protein [Halioglobus sp.]
MNTLELWHEMVVHGNPDRLDEILTEDCVFLSPVVHKPQVGRELTKFYLTGAMNVFNESFEYVKEVVTPEHAVLEFVCDLDGIIVNGVDIITFAADGKISEFKVMIRPLKAVNMLHEKMRLMLEQLSA